MGEQKVKDLILGIIAVVAPDAANTSPSAGDIQITAREDKAHGILLDASDAEHNELKFLIAEPPSHGIITGVAPDIVYRPEENFFGEDSFEFLANDGLADSNTATVRIIVTPVNDAPVADAGPYQAVQEGTAGTLDGSDSYDPDDEVENLTFQWTQTSGPPAVLSDPGQAVAGFTMPAQGPDAEFLAFKLMVKDPGGLESDDSCIVSAGENIPPYPPINLSPANHAVFATGPVTLITGGFADSENDEHIETHWLVRRADGEYGAPDYNSSFDYIATASGLVEHTVSGLEPGLEYAWKAGCKDAGSLMTTWSDESFFVIGVIQTDTSVSVPAASSPADSTMVSFVIWPDDPSSMSVFGDELGGKYAGGGVTIGTYDPELGGYIEVSDGMEIIPGKAYWITPPEGMDIEVDGVPVTTDADVGVPLGYNESNGDGWNMIACPNNADYHWNDVEIIVYDDNGDIIFGPMAIGELHDDNPYMDKRLWIYVNGEYFLSRTWMVRNKGYWVRTTAKNVTLNFPESVRAILENPEDQALEKATGDLPPRPIDNSEADQASQVDLSNENDISRNCFIGAARGWF